MQHKFNFKLGEICKMILIHDIMNILLKILWVLRPVSLAKVMGPGQKFWPGLGRVGSAIFGFGMDLEIFP